MIGWREEVNMPGPLAMELRERAVEAYENGEGTYQEIARRFNVGEASLNRWLRRKRETGSVAPKPMGGRRHGKLTDEAKEYMADLVRDEPQWTTSELAEEVGEAFGISVSRQVVGKALNEMGFTFKRGSSERQLPDGRRSSSDDSASSTSRATWMESGSSSSTSPG